MEKEISTIELYDLLKEASPVRFDFSKKNGEISEAYGTKNPILIPKEFQPKEDPEKNMGENLKYYDLTKGGWRSLSYECQSVTLISE